MNKYGVIKLGKTPSQESNKPSTKIVDGEPLCDDEKLVKVALFKENKPKNIKDEKK